MREFMSNRWTDVAIKWEKFDKAPICSYTISMDSFMLLKPVQLTHFQNMGHNWLKMLTELSFARLLNFKKLYGPEIKHMVFSCIHLEM